MKKYKGFCKDIDQPLSKAVKEKYEEYLDTNEPITKVSFNF